MNFTYAELNHNRFGYNPERDGLERILSRFLERFSIEDVLAEELRGLVLAETDRVTACEYIDSRRVRWSRKKPPTLLELRTALERDGLVGHLMGGLENLRGERRHLRWDSLYLVLPPHTSQGILVETGFSKGQPTAKVRLEDLTTRLEAHRNGQVYIYTLPPPSP